MSGAEVIPVGNPGDGLAPLVEELGDSRIVNLALGPQRVRLKTDAALTAREGDAVHLSFAPEAAHLFDRASGERLS